LPASLIVILFVVKFSRKVSIASLFPAYGCIYFCFSEVRLQKRGMALLKITPQMDPVFQYNPKKSAAN